MERQGDHNELVESTKNLEELMHESISSIAETYKAHSLKEVVKGVEHDLESAQAEVIQFRAKVIYHKEKAESIKTEMNVLDKKVEKAINCDNDELALEYLKKQKEIEKDYEFHCVQCSLNESSLQTAIEAHSLLKIGLDELRRQSHSLERAFQETVVLINQKGRFHRANQASQAVKCLESNVMQYKAIGTAIQQFLDDNSDAKIQRLERCEANNELARELASRKSLLKGQS
jgi:phage shock protein A